MSQLLIVHLINNRKALLIFCPTSDKVLQQTVICQCDHQCDHQNDHHPVCHPVIHQCDHQGMSLSVVSLRDCAKIFNPLSLSSITPISAKDYVQKKVIFH